MNHRPQVATTLISKNFHTPAEMHIRTVKVSEKGQIAIPTELREHIGLKKGDVLVVLEEGGRLLLQKAEGFSKQAHEEFRRVLKLSEGPLKKLWSGKADDVWDTV
jgi:AbrB family looped-hinge helix DNA binding protein